MHKAISKTISMKGNIWEALDSMGSDRSKIIQDLVTEYLKKEGALPEQITDKQKASKVFESVWDTAEANGMTIDEFQIFMTKTKAEINQVAV